MRERTSLRVDAPRAVMLCAPLLGLAAFAVLEWAEWGASRDGRARGGSDELAVWEFLVTASVVVWGLLAAVGLRLLADLDARTGPWRPRRRETALFVLYVYLAIALVLVAGGIAGLRNPFVIVGQDWKVPLLHVLAGVANLPLLIVLTRIELRARSDEGGWSGGPGDFDEIRFLRRCTHTATACLGLVIALAVIATGALREATAAAGLTPVPETFVLVYGAWFTGVVAATYLHVFGAIERRGRWIVDTIAPLRDIRSDGAEAFTGSRAVRAELAQELGLGGDARHNLESLLAVLAPLAGALLTRLGGI